MKKLFFIILTSLIVAGTGIAQQSQKELKKELKDKAIREARKESKKLKKTGWDVAPGSIPMSKVLEQAWMKQVELDEKGGSRYIFSDGNAVGETKSAAEMQAVELGKLQLAGMLQTNMSSLISANIGNAQLSTKDAASVTEVVQSAKNIIAMELGYVDPTFKLYKFIGDDKVEVQIRLFYDTKQSMEIAKKVVRTELKDKLKLNEEQLDKLMGL